MKKPTKIEANRAALEALGWTRTLSKSTKYEVWTNGGISRFYLGKAGAARRGTTTRGSVPSILAPMVARAVVMYPADSTTARKLFDALNKLVMAGEPGASVVLNRLEGGLTRETVALLQIKEGLTCA